MKPEGGFGGASFASPTPVVVPIVIAVCVAVQLTASLAGPEWATALARHAALIPGRLTGHLPSLPRDVPAPLTLLTALFLHAGWLHLVINLTFLLWVGHHVEPAIGRARFVLLYLASGIVGGLLQVAVDPTSSEQVVGASGAIAGIFGAFATLFACSRAGPRRVLGVMVAGEVMTALWIVATWVGLQLLTAAAFNTGEGGIAIWTHIGGFIVGLIAAQVLARRRS